MIDIEVADRQSVFTVDTTRLSDVCRRILADHGYTSASLSLAVVDDAQMHPLNRKYLEHDYTTDVLSFVLEYSDDSLSGEVVVCSEVAQRSAAEIGASPGDELLLYVIHGVLHLVGFRDKSSDDAHAMRGAESKYLTAAGLEASTVDLLVYPDRQFASKGVTTR